MHRGSWDDLRYVLAVVECGSLSAAARRLGVNHATVLRRVAAFEEAYGGPVFERTQSGYALISDRMRVIDAAQEVANAMNTVERLMQGGRATLRGLVRISSTDTLCQRLLPPLMRRLDEEFADLAIELISTNSHLDFSRMQAHVTLRPAARLGDDLRGEIGARLGFAVYAARNGADKWLGLSGALSRSAPAEWLTRHGPQDETIASADSFMVLQQMARAGMGRSFLPCFLGDADPELERVHCDAPQIEVPIWVASHSDLADTPRLRALRQRIIAYLGEHSARLAGTVRGDAR